MDRAQGVEGRGLYKGVYLVGLHGERGVDDVEASGEEALVPTGYGGRPCGEVVREGVAAHRHLHVAIVQVFHRGVPFLEVVLGSVNLEGCLIVIDLREGDARGVGIVLYHVESVAAVFVADRPSAISF